MALRNIRIKGDPILNKVCKPVTKFDERLWVLLDDMYETMSKAEGVGLAAPQVGILKRAVVIDVGEGKLELINPEVIETSGQQTDKEGCLSVPEEWYDVTRPNYAKVRAQDRNGNRFEVEGEGLMARALLHEAEHLDGILFISHVEGYEL